LISNPDQHRINLTKGGNQEVGGKYANGEGMTPTSLPCHIIFISGWAELRNDTKNVQIAAFQKKASYPMRNVEDSG
jgi:hypothetical protein